MRRPFGTHNTMGTQTGLSPAVPQFPPAALWFQPSIDFMLPPSFPSAAASRLVSELLLQSSGLQWAQGPAFGRRLSWRDVKVAEVLARIRAVKTGESCVSWGNLELVLSRSENYRDF